MFQELLEAKDLISITSPPPVECPVPYPQECQEADNLRQTAQGERP